MSDKLPTANEIIDENLGGLELTMDDDMWKFYKDIIRQTIESHTQAHTAGLREEINSLQEDLSGERILLEAARKQLSVYEERVKELDLQLTIAKAYLDRIAVMDFGARLRSTLLEVHELLRMADPHCRDSALEEMKDIIEVALKQ